MPKILLLLAQRDYQPKEYEDTKMALIAAGYTVLTASPLGGTAQSATGEEIMTDLRLSDVLTLDYIGVFLIGGAGALLSLDNKDTLRIIQEAKESDEMVYGAICIAPRILAKAGLLRDIHITGWNRDGKFGTICENGGCIHTPKPVVRDGRVITANGPMSAKEFGEEIARALSLQKEKQ